MMPATITLTGRIVAIDSYEASNGSTIVKLRIPNDVGYGDRKTTTWWTATIFGKSAESAARHLGKGSWVCVTGEPSVREYTNKQREMKVSAEINVLSWGFVGNKAASEDAQPARKPRAPKAAPAPDYTVAFQDDGDIPF